MSSGWLSRNRYLIRMSYDNVIMSSGWHRLPFVSHPDETVNFDFPHHAVALQRFRRIGMWIHQCSFVFVLTIDAMHLFILTRILLQMASSEEDDPDLGKQCRRGWQVSKVKATPVTKVSRIWLQLPSGHDTKMTSLWRQSDVAASFWRHNTLLLRTYMLQLAGSSLFQVIACRLFGVKVNNYLKQWWTINRTLKTVHWHLNQIQNKFVKKMPSAKYRPFWSDRSKLKRTRIKSIPEVVHLPPTIHDTRYWSALFRV